MVVSTIEDASVDIRSRGDCKRREGVLPERDRHPAHLQDAYEVAKVVPRYQNMDKVTDFSRPDIKVRVVFGRDLLPYAMALLKDQGKGPRS